MGDGFFVVQCMCVDSFDTEAFGAKIVESWYMRLIGLPTEAILFRPREFGWPPGIQARLFISGFRALFFRIGDRDDFEFASIALLTEGLRLLELARFGILNVGKDGRVFSTPYWALITALRARVFLCDKAVVSRDAFFALRYGCPGNPSLFWRLSPTMCLLFALF